MNLVKNGNKPKVISLTPIGAGLAASKFLSAKLAKKRANRIKNLNILLFL
jgi:hypothetical protein